LLRAYESKLLANRELECGSLCVDRRLVGNLSVGALNDARN